MYESNQDIIFEWQLWNQNPVPDEVFAIRIGLDTGSCLRNIESFMTTSAVVMQHGLGRYILNVDIRQLAEYLLLTKDIPAWEKFCEENKPNTNDGLESLSQSVMNMANQLSADLNVTMANWDASDDEDNDLDATK